MATTERPLVSALHRDHLDAAPTPPDTHVDARGVGGPDLRPRRRTGGITRDGVLNLLGALAAALCTSVLLFGRIAPFSGLIAFVVVTYLLFLLSYAVLVGLQENAVAVRDRLSTVICGSLAMLVILVLVDITIFTFVRGSKALFHLNFFTQDLSRAGPLQPLTIGGAQHAIVGSLEMIAIALLITVPLGLTCAVYLSEVRNRFSSFVGTIVQTMTALPSIIAGLFVYLVWELVLHHQPSGFAAALATSIMVLPIIIRTSDVILRLVPGNLKEASAALGAPRWRTMWHVVLPTARSGLTTAVILGMARGLGETAPVLLTAGYTYNFNANPFSGPMVSLPLMAFELVKSPEKTQIQRGFAAAAFLLLLVVVLFAIARVIGGRPPGRLSPRQAARVARRSARDQARFDRRALAPVSTAAPDPHPQLPPDIAGAPA